MKRVELDNTQRRNRLRLRLGGKARTWVVRLKPGGHITLPSALLRALNWCAGDVLEFDLTPEGTLKVARAKAKRKASHASIS